MAQPQEIKSTLIQSCMDNDLSLFLPFLNSSQVEIDGRIKEKFYTNFKNILAAAHKKNKGDWSMAVEKAHWIKDKNAVAYEFYVGSNNRPVITVLIEEKENVLWMEVYK